MTSPDMTTFSSESRLSGFYCACRDNDIKKAKQFLRKITVAEINHIESNGSTALHIACHRNHFDIVQLLLNHGACRSILNLHNLTPYDETIDENIKKLFYRNERDYFISPYGTITWHIWNPSTWDSIRAMNMYLECELYRVGLVTMLKHLQEHYLPCIRLNEKEKQQIKWFFDKAIATQSSLPIFRAYSTPTKFHKIVNEHLAKALSRPIRIDPARRSLTVSVYYLASIFTFSSINNIRPTGFETFRGMIMSKNELKKYRRGDIVVNTALVSTSENRSVASAFAGDNQGQLLRQSKGRHKLQIGAILHYKFRPNTDRSMSMSMISEFRDEDEVIIKPLTPFKVIVLRNQDTTNEESYEIDLEECDLNSVGNPEMYNMRHNINYEENRDNDGDNFGMTDPITTVHLSDLMQEYRAKRNEYDLKKSTTEYLPIYEPFDWSSSSQSGSLRSFCVNSIDATSKIPDDLINWNYGYTALSNISECLEHHD